MSSTPTQPQINPSTQSHESGMMMRGEQGVDQAQASATHAAAGQEKQAKSHRTTGNKVFDWVLYPLIPFGGVFAASVLGGREFKFGNGKLNSAFNWIAESVELVKTNGLVQSVKNGWNTLRESGASEVFKTGKIAPSLGTVQTTLVLVSFAIGTLFMGPVKLFENKRNQISAWIDKKLGTTPKEGEHIKPEPNQSWGSVLGGRALTFLTVLGLDKIIGGHIESLSEKAGDWLATKWARTSHTQGEVLAALRTEAKELKRAVDPVSVARKEEIASEMRAVVRGAGKKWQISFMSAYEGIYTALCTVLVYAISRGLAGVFNKPKASADIEPLANTTAKAEPLAQTSQAPAAEVAQKEASAVSREPVRRAKDYTRSDRPPVGSKAEQVLARKEQAAEAGVAMAH